MIEMEPDQIAVVEGIHVSGGMGRRLWDLGLIEDTNITCVHRGSGSMSAYLIRGAVVALRHEITDKIMVRLE